MMPCSTRREAIPHKVEVGLFGTPVELSSLRVLYYGEEVCLLDVGQSGRLRLLDKVSDSRLGT
jgi:hypothetical protein